MLQPGDTPLRLTTGNGALALEFSPGATAAITAMHLTPDTPSSSAMPTPMGGFALREYPSGRTCNGLAPVNSSAANQSLLINGDFSQAGASPQTAAAWAPFSTGSRRATGSGIARPGDSATILVETTGTDR